MAVMPDKTAAEEIKAGAAEETRAAGAAEIRAVGEAKATINPPNHWIARKRNATLAKSSSTSPANTEPAARRRKGYARTTGRWARHQTAARTALSFAKVPAIPRPAGRERSGPRLTANGPAAKARSSSTRPATTPVLLARLEHRRNVFVPRARFGTRLQRPVRDARTAWSARLPTVNARRRPCRKTARVKAVRQAWSRKTGNANARKEPFSVPMGLAKS